MYDSAKSSRSAGRQFDAPVSPLPIVAAPVVLARVRKILGEYLPGMGCERRWRETLAAPMAQPALERERLFTLGWLNWLDGNWPIAEGLLAEADMRCRAPLGDETVEAELPVLDAGVLAARSAYWCARVRVLLRRSDAITDYEAAMRRLGGSPQSTAWYVDLLWRAGRIDRAKQVWKSLRTNKRVLCCDEAPLLEARVLLSKGETVSAAEVLGKAVPTNGVVWVERQLLWCWTKAGTIMADHAPDDLRLAFQGPYPAAALAEWRHLLHAHVNSANHKPEAQARDTSDRSLARRAYEPTSPGWSEFVRAQEARLAGKHDEAVTLYRAALAHPAAQSFAHFGLACLGEEEMEPPRLGGETVTDPESLVRRLPDCFFALRCWMHQTIESFRRREASAAELLEVLQEMTTLEYRGGAMEHFTRLAVALKGKQPAAAELARLVSGESPGAAQRNAIKIALEQACRWLLPAEALPVVRDLAAQAGDDAKLREAIDRQLQRLALLLGDHDGELGLGAHDRPPGLLWQAAQLLHTGGVDDGWREQVRTLLQQPYYQGVVQALLLQESAHRGDLAVVGALLEELELWRAFRPGPPRFVLRVLLALVGSHPTFIGWRQALPAWLSLWDSSALGSEGASLALAAGVSAAGESEEAPAGVAPAAWFLHQAARAFQREDAVAAQAFTQRALDTGKLLPSAEIVESALPVMKRRADEQALARCLGQADSSPGVLADLVDLLGEAPDGATVLQSARQGNAAAVWAGLDELGKLPGLPGRLHHHLALASWRSALHWERRGEADRAAVLWQMAWRGWLAFLASSDAPTADEQSRLLDHLLAVHARHINTLLASAEPRAARVHWMLVQSLAAESENLANRVAQFSAELATQYLMNTREAMRHGQVPEGWRADYERGLGLLSRLLSLDRDNVRLLTALVEICDSWFIDLDNTHDPERLREQAKRFTPFGLQLARIVGNAPDELPARSALGEFWKFRALVESDPVAKAHLFREALRLDPTNDNVRELLAELGVSDAETENSDPEGSDDE
jgi:hypothetical protein